MTRERKWMLIGLVTLAVLSLLLVFLWNLPEKTEQKEQQEVYYLQEHPFMDLAYLSVENEHGFYDVTQESGGFRLYDLPGDLINTDYLQLLLDECSRIAVREKVVAQAEDLSIYGLDKPRARVHVKYTDGSTADLSIGMEETLSDGVYVQLQGDSAVYLMPRSYTIRFTMPVEHFIKYEIIPTRKLPSPLSVIRDITFSGISLKEPIVIQYVDEKNEQEMREAASFGVSTHLIRAPGLHEMDQAAGAEIFQSLLGLISEEIVDYNCTEKELAEYGFQNPDLDIAFTMVNGQDAAEETYHLRVVKRPDGSLIAECNGRGAVYRILDVAFTTVSYEKLAMRWFLTPFITDLSKVQVSSSGSTMEFQLTGESNKDLSILLDGTSLDVDQFRAYYRLLISACNDGKPIEPATVKGDPLLQVTYRYKDLKKSEDVMQLYEGVDARSVVVSINGTSEFTMNRAYLDRVLQAEQSLKNGTAIKEEW